MLPRNHVFNSTRFPRLNLSSTSLHSLQPSIVSKQRTRRRFTSTSTITNSNSVISLNISNSTSTLSTQQQQQLLVEDSYSPKTGIKTAALLGGMLILVIVYLIWKARSRLCRPSRSASVSLSHGRQSGSKFDLDYWLKQVDLLEAKEMERNRGGQSLYLELPNQEPRNNQQATASWIVDAYRQWRLLQYRRQEQLFRSSTVSDETANPPPIPYRRRRQLLRRFFRRYFSSSRRNPSLFAEHSSTLLAGMRPSIVSNNYHLSPLLVTEIPGIRRRANSWPRLKTNSSSTGMKMSALQTHHARNRLLKQPNSRTTSDIQ